MRPLARKVPLALLALLSLPGEATPSWRRSGPDGGMVRTIAVDVAHAGTLYAATGSGVFKTTDGGEGWTGPAPVRDFRARTSATSRSTR
jgi:photosystem II stability/assembly factor-like uncharacterized protein